MGRSIESFPTFEELFPFWDGSIEVARKRYRTLLESFGEKYANEELFSNIEKEKFANSFSIVKSYYQNEILEREDFIKENLSKAPFKVQFESKMDLEIKRFLLFKSYETSILQSYPDIDSPFSPVKTFYRNNNPISELNKARSQKKIARDKFKILVKHFLEA